jgi:bacteriocin-like protein
MNTATELSINELDAVNGGVLAEACAAARCIGAAVSTIAGVNNVLAAAVEGIPPAPCHPK